MKFYPRNLEDPFGIPLSVIVTHKVFDTMFLVGIHYHLIILPLIRTSIDNQSTMVMDMVFLYNRSLGNVSLAYFFEKYEMHN